MAQLVEQLAFNQWGSRKTVLGKVTCLGNDTVRIDFNHQMRAITAGQSSVFYDPSNPSDVIGGGHIHQIIF